MPSTLRENSIGERARGHWKMLLPAFGVDPRLLTGKHVPCPICGGKDRFRFDDKDGRGTFICNQCRAGDGVTLIQRLKGWDFLQVVDEIEKIIGNEPAAKTTGSTAVTDSTADKYRQALALWRTGRPIEAGDPAHRYLCRRLGKFLPSRALRFIPDTPHCGRGYPALVAAYVDIHGDLAGVQRTFLTAEGTKAAGLEATRWNTGTLPDGGAIRLARHEKALGIAEGVETALAGSIMFGIPVWAALNAGRLKVWQPPEGVTEVVIFGDADAKNVGQAAAYALGERLNRTIAAQVMIPPITGTDWNDVLHERLASAADVNCRALGSFD